ncbi:MAG: Ig-like domain-containing protein [Bacteroidales bacterium]|nr:Ig-like domain-containing protein [Bacteroidales bacterium]
MTLQEISTPVTSIALNAESLHITTTTKSASLEATVTPADATLKDLYWTSSDPLIATVDQNGLVTRRREGSATITACAIDGSGAMANCQVTVDAIIAESLELSPAELSLSPNKSYRINAIYTPDDISSKNFEWSCSDEGVATFIKNLDGSIIVTAIAYGNATITCRTTDGSNLTATCEVTVVPELELDPSEITLSRNKTAVIYPVFLPEGTPDRPCEWSCSDESVVRYKANSDGSITIIGASDGKAIITCHTTDGSDLTATCEVTVGTGTGVEGVSSTAAKVRGENGVIRVEGAEGARVEVYSASGVCIYSGTATEVPVPQRGLYVVKVAGRATKLAM